ncbi:1763_t:CDS:2 [Diversispora eburnea]|uniref:1763_t:CDS:1 n=1 Tax=Diversispora eburnea TaxID=1213867 RepID=A0A9N9A6C8_9GLOM|nr:1763_t:CDS:2 [Diversispora eburnea]
MVDNEKIPNQLVLSFDGKKLDIITGIPYKISSDKLYIDDWGGNHGSSPRTTGESHPPEHENYFRQIFVIRGTSCTRRYKIFINGNYMDSWGGNVNDTKLYLSSTDNPPEHPCYSRQIWSFYSATDSKSKEYQIQNEQNNHFLDTLGNGGGFRIGFWSTCKKPTDEHYSRQLWKFTPAFNYKLNVAVGGFKYKLPSDIKRQQIRKTLHEDILNNLDSSAELIPTFNFTEELTNTYSFSFNKSLEFIPETKLTTVIPFTDIEKEFNFKYSFEANEPITTKKKESYTIAKKVKVPPNSCIKAIDYIDFVENIEIPYEATAEITAIGDRYKKDGTIIKNAKVDSDAVKLFLRENNFQGEILRSEKNFVLVKVQGTFRGSYVLRTYRKLEDMNVESSSHGSSPCENHPPEHEHYFRQAFVIRGTSCTGRYKMFINGNYMDSWGGGNCAKLFLSSNDNPPGHPYEHYSRQLWKLTPSFDCKLNAVVDNFNFEANEPITTKKKGSYVIAKKVKVPPNSCIKSIDYVDFVNNEIPFEATAEITAIGDRYKKDGTIIKNAKVDSDAAKLFLIENNFQGKII